MRALILLLCIIINASAFAKEKGELVLTVRVKKKYSTENSKIFRRTDGVICSTEHSPLVPVTAIDFKFLSALAEAFRKEGEVKKRDCEEVAFVAIPGKKAGANCVDQAKELLKAVSRICGRN